MSVRSVLAACALPVGSVAVLLVALAVAGELPLALPSAAALVRLSLVLLAGIAFSLAFSTLAWVQVARENKVLGRRKVLEGLGIRETPESRRLVVGFFHPFCHAGGGGERVLYEAIAHHQRNDPSVVCVVYTGDLTSQPSDKRKEAILQRCRERFGITVQPDTVAFVPVRYRRLVEDDYWRHFTLLGQSLGSVFMAQEAVGRLTPDVFVDSMGYAFSLPVVKFVSPQTRVCLLYTSPSPRDRG